MAEINEPLNSEEVPEITGYTLEEATVIYATVDSTLSIGGQAADAKVTGDALRAVAKYNTAGDIVITTLS